MANRKIISMADVDVKAAGNADQLTSVAEGEAARAGSPIPIDLAAWTQQISGTGSIVGGMDPFAGEFVTLATTAASQTYRAGRAINRVLGGGKHISFLVRKNTAETSVIDFWGSLGAAGLTPATRWNKGTTGMTVGKWYRVGFSLAETPTGTPANYLDFRDFVVQVTGNASGAGSVSIADVKLHQTKPKARIAFFFDDGRLDTYTEGYNYLKTKNFPGAIAVEHTAVGAVGAGTASRMTMAQLREVYDAGWDLSGHHTAQMTSLSAADQELVHQASKRFLADNGFVRGNRLWVWPGGARNDAAEALALKYWKTARRVSSFAGTGIPHVYDPVDPPVWYIQTSNTLPNVQAMIDRVDAAGGAAVMVFHSIVASPVAAEDVTPAFFQGIVDHVATKTNTEVVPTSKIWSL
jgi:peptidoglycan/xylan/chitin deacetylase (PgdA/CDA1 family)